MAYNNILGNKPLDKLTDAEANEILKIGKNILIYNYFQKLFQK